MEHSLKFTIEIIGQIQSISNDNVDVYITFENGDKYFATFFTLKNISDLLESYLETGENNNGAFFWSTNMIICKELSMDGFRITVNNLLLSNSFHSAFSLVN